jgi:phage recombination protein Bet
MWKDEAQLKTIKSIYAPNLSDGEFQTFVQLGIATGLNPFLREIWAIKYDKSAPAQIFIGRDGYRKSISRNTIYAGHHVDAVYANDDFCFDLTNGEVRHTYNLKDRGKLMGAYCIVHMKNVPRPYYVFVDISEYNTNQSNWKNKPATMIKKVAECQAIRMADSCTFGNTYDEDELPEYMRQENKSSQLNKRLELKKADNQTIDGEIVNQETGEVTNESAPIENAEQNNELPFSINEIELKIQNAKSIQELVEAVDLVNSLPSSHMEAKKSLMQIYRQRQKELA